MISQEYLKEIYKKTPIIKSSIESILLIFISYFAISAISSDFLKNYYWIYAFSFFVNGYLTITLSGRKKTVTNLFFQKFKIILIFYFISSLSFVFFNKSESVDFLLLFLLFFLLII